MGYGNLQSRAMTSLDHLEIPNTSSNARSSSPPSLTHAFLTQQNFTNPSPCSQFFCVYEVAQTPHLNNMSGANTKSVLARFCDNNWKKGRDFVKTFYVKKLMWEREGMKQFPCQKKHCVCNGNYCILAFNYCSIK